mgnify:CR=1 FL=1
MLHTTTVHIGVETTADGKDIQSSLNITRSKGDAQTLHYTNAAMH